MIYVVRHGETEWNAINKVLGRTDIPLNANGVNQARELARSMKDLKIDVFLCSPLLRTRQTADIISSEMGVQYEIDNRLIEQEFGEFEGVNRSDPKYQKAKREYFVRYPGGESYFDTIVDSSLQGQGVAGKLVQAAVEDIKSQGGEVRATCSYAVKWLEKHA